MSIPTLTPIESSQLESVAHDPQTETLFIRFKSSPEGVVYSYAKFPAAKFAEFMAAPSQGSFFYKQIKGRHEFTKHVPESDSTAAANSAAMDEARRM
jgi:hypothetical protein